MVGKHMCDHDDKYDHENNDNDYDNNTDKLWRWHVVFHSALSLPLRLRSSSPHLVVLSSGRCWRWPLEVGQSFTLFTLFTLWLWIYCRSLMKVKFSTDKFRRALGSGGCLFVDCRHAQKPENCPFSDLFNLTLKYFLPLLHYNDLVPSSSDPAPPSTNQYRPILTQHHQIVTSTAQYYHVSTSSTSYWPSDIIYQPVLPYTDPAPPSNNQYRLLLTQ